jgi:hypothetical protein
VKDERKAPHERKPKHVAGRNVYVQLRTYDPVTQKMKHRGFIALKRWTAAEVREIIIETFTARQVLRGEAPDPLAWVGGDSPPRGPNAQST